MASAIETENAQRMASGSTGQYIPFATYNTGVLSKGDLAKLSGVTDFGYTAMPNVPHSKSMFSYGDSNADQNRLIDFENDKLRGATWQKNAQGLARANGDKDLFTKLGGTVDENDPWGFYRENAGNQLNNQFLNGATDPSDYYRSKLQALSSGQFGPSDPSYQWRFEQGQQAVERSNAAKGLLNSGNAAIELQQYGQGAASQEYQAEFQRTLQGLSGVESQYNTQFSRLASMAGITLDPTGTDKIQTSQQGNAVQAQGNQLNYSAKMADINNNQMQWQDQLGMAQAYDKGLGDTLSKLSGADQSSIYSSYAG